MAQTKTNLPLSASQPFKGDISTLQIKGHFYFALTGKRLSVNAK